LQTYISANPAARRVFTPDNVLRAVDENSLADALRNHPHVTLSHHTCGGFNHISNFVLNYLT
jgi:hypothetical protein